MFYFRRRHSLIPSGNFLVTVADTKTKTETCVPQFFFLPRSPPTPSPPAPSPPPRIFYLVLVLLDLHLPVLFVFLAQREREREVASWSWVVVIVISMAENAELPVWEVRFHCQAVHHIRQSILLLPPLGSNLLDACIHQTQGYHISPFSRVLNGQYSTSGYPCIVTYPPGPLHSPEIDFRFIPDMGAE